MARNVEIKYNPYVPQLEILIDGMQPPDFSRLIQYFDEDIWVWAPEIMEVIYSEVRDDFVVTFIGTEQDANILHFISEKNSRCVRFNYIDFQINYSLPDRMKQLNQLIKRAGIMAYERTIIDAMFIVPPIMQQYLDNIISIDISNLFCAVRVNTMGINKEYIDNENSTLFVLADSFESGNYFLKQIKIVKPAFILVIGSQNRILSIEKNQWYLETTQENLINTIFDCFIQIPLLEAFRKCVSSIHGGRKLLKEVKNISSVEPIIDVFVEKEVEVGRSIRLSIMQKSDIGGIPKLVFKIRNQQVASCDGLSVYGLSEGDSILEVYKYGAKQPFFEKNIHVFKRNRIKKMILSEDTAMMGISDKKRLLLNYYPADADNANEILWESTDENVLSVDGNGNIEALSAGTCRIICKAENVSAQCICMVKPYLEDLVITLPLDENNSVIVAPFKEMPITYECIPTNSIDDDITISSSNNDIVNVVNSTLCSKNSGKATITLKNSSGRISRSFNVVVSGWKKQKSKSGFFNKLFK